ncbi:hypothetical protein C8039_01595 [Halogeometricum sp. wsp3]|nr:hypothetical protein C8039_01595 [Halogeometricum sp. wsp3]
MEILEDHGVNTIEHHVFEDFDAGSTRKDDPAPYVIKPLGKSRTSSDSSTSGTRTTAVIRRRASCQRERTGGPTDGKNSYRASMAGVEIDLIVRDLPLRLVRRASQIHRRTVVDPANIGPSTGEMGTSMFWAGRNELFEETLGKAEGWLTDEGYVDIIDINCTSTTAGSIRWSSRRAWYPTIALQKVG